MIGGLWIRIVTLASRDSFSRRSRFARPIAIECSQRRAPETLQFAMRSRCCSPARQRFKRRHRLASRLRRTIRQTHLQRRVTRRRPSGLESVQSASRRFRRASTSVTTTARRSSQIRKPSSVACSTRSTRSKPCSARGAWAPCIVPAIGCSGTSSRSRCFAATNARTFAGAGASSAKVAAGASSGGAGEG